VRSTRPRFLYLLLFLSALLYFAVERLVDYAVSLLALGGETHWPATIASAALAMGCAYAILPWLINVITLPSARSRMEHARFLAAAESSLDDFYIFDGVPNETGEIVDFRFNYLNPNAERRLNLTRHELVGKILTEVRPFMISSGLIGHYREVVRTGTPFATEIYIDDDRIRATWISVQVVKLGDGIAITSRDITESKRISDHVTHMAHHDHLTGLPNRTLLRDRLHQAIMRAQRHEFRVAIFMLDIDHFKKINDTYGHAHGDALLFAVGKRLLASVRETDTVARIGGDEFVIVMPDFKTLDDVKRCAHELVEKTALPLPLEDEAISITLSIGLCIYPDCEFDEEQLLKNADAAMYTVKARGRNGLHLFNEGQAGEVQDESA
jgi:diguanylate cyclase (GGDEF)-like protein